MERIVFLVEETGEQVACLLNPETVTIRRRSGISELPFEGMPLNANGRSDTPVVLTGGGQTNIELDLLFDISLDTSAEPTDDVRTLTLPLWRLTENAIGHDGLRRIPTVWILWGRQWSVLCVVEAIAERFESISPTGAPGRSWISLRARRVSDTVRVDEAGTAGVPTSKPLPTENAPSAITATGDGGTADGFEGVRADAAAAQLLGDAARWPELCEANGIDDPTRIPAGTILRVPEGSAP